MEISIRDTIKEIMADRPYFAMIIALLGAGLLYSAFVVLTVEPRDIQVITQYTSFGESHFYKDKYFYLYGMALFGLGLSVIHAGIMTKLYAYDRRDMGMVFGVISLGILVIATIYANEVMNLAYL